MPVSVRCCSRLFSAVLALLAFAAGASLAAGKTYDVYLVAGQSNTDGRGYNSDLTGALAAYAGVQTGVKLYYVNPANSDPVNPTHKTGWVDLAPGYSNAPTLPGTRFGFEVSLGKALAARDPGRHIALIKVARGGTSLSTDWDPAGGANYMWRTFANTVPAALAALTAGGDTATIRGMFWHQGESDGGNPTYQNDLVQLIASARSLAGRPQLPFAIGELERDHVTPTVANRTYQLNAMANVDAADPNSFVVSSDGLLTYDGTHFTSAAYITLGERFATAMHAWLDQPYTVTFDPAGGSSSSPVTTTVNMDLPYGTLPLTTRTGYTFVGWFTAPAGGTQITSSTPVTIAQNHTLHARWNIPPSITVSPPAPVALEESTSWSPAKITTAAWFDAADTATLTLSSGSVSAWADKSGRANHATQPTAAVRPTTGTATLGGLPTVSFRVGNGTSKQFLSAAHHASLNLDASGGANIFAVFRHLGFVNNGSTAINAPLAKGQVLGADSSYGIRLGNDQALSFKAGTDSLTSASSPDSANQALLFSGTRNDSTHLASVYLQGTLANSATKATAILSDNTHPLHLGRDAGSALYTNIDFGEILVLGGTLSATERQRIEGYLAHKWDLAAALPAAHPHKTEAPVELSAVASLAASVTDPEGDPLTHLWSVVSGPAPVTFGNASALATTATFTSTGLYTLRLTSNDGFSSVSADLAITVTDAPSPASFAAWADQGSGETGDAITFTSDINRDGVADGLAWLLGATSPTTRAIPISLTASTNNGAFETAFTLLTPARRGSSVMKIQYSTDLAAWTTVTVPDTDGTHSGVTFAVTPHDDLLDVRATLPATLSGNSGRLFLRLLGELALP